MKGVYSTYYSTSLGGSQGRNSSKQPGTSRVKSREKISTDPCLLAFQLLSFSNHTVQDPCLGNGAAHNRLGLLHKLTIKTVPHGTDLSYLSSKTTFSGYPRPAVLNLWVVTSLGSEWLFHKDQPITQDY